MYFLGFHYAFDIFLYMAGVTPDQAHSSKDPVTRRWASRQHHQEVEREAVVELAEAEEVEVVEISMLKFSSLYFRERNIHFKRTTSTVMIK